MNFHSKLSIDIFLITLFTAGITGTFLKNASGEQLAQIDGKCYLCIFNLNITYFNGIINGVGKLFQVLIQLVHSLTQQKALTAPVQNSFKFYTHRKCLVHSRDSAMLIFMQTVWNQNNQVVWSTRVVIHVRLNCIFHHVSKKMCSLVRLVISHLFKVALDSTMMVKTDAFSLIHPHALDMPKQTVHHSYSITYTFRSSWMRQYLNKS